MSLACLGLRAPAHTGFRVNGHHGPQAILLQRVFSLLSLDKLD